MNETKPSLAVVILTKNEQLHLARCLDSVADIATDIYVVDSYSDDRTVAIARARGAEVVQHPFVNQAKQFNWAMQSLPIKASWVMRLDADEVVGPDLRSQIADCLKTAADDVIGVNLKRRHIFMNRWVRHGGRYPVTLLRIWRTGTAEVEDRWMDEHVVLKKDGSVITLDGAFSDHNLHDLTYFTAKHNAYATREAVMLLMDRHGITKPAALASKRTSFQASLKRVLKQRVYNALPFTVSATLYFLWRYVFRLGFLDGRSGLVYHFLQGFWYRFLVGAKVMELEQALDGKQDRAEILHELERHTGLKLAEAVAPG